MIKVIERKTSIQIHCTHADWPLVRYCLDEGIKTFAYNRPTYLTEELKAWRLNGAPQHLSDLPEIDKS